MGAGVWHSQSQPSTVTAFPGSQTAGRHQISPTELKMGLRQVSPTGREQSCGTFIPQRASPPGTHTSHLAPPTHCGDTGALLYPAVTKHTFFPPSLGVFLVQPREEWSLVRSRKQHLPRAASPIRAGPVLLFLSLTAPFSLVTLFCYYSAHSFLWHGCDPLLLEGCHLHFLKLFSSPPFFSACFSKGS